MPSQLLTSSVLNINTTVSSSILEKTKARPGKGKKNSAYQNLMFLHWLMAVVIALLFLTGFFVPRLPNLQVLRSVIPYFHQSFGLLFLMFLVSRLFLLIRLAKLRNLQQIRTLSLRKKQSLVFRLVLYGFMLLAPMSGLFCRNLMGKLTIFFGVHVPSVLNENFLVGRWVQFIHMYACYIFLLLILGHAWAQKKYVLRMLSPTLFK